jgi:hypothetical protein
LYCIICKVYNSGKFSSFLKAQLFTCKCVNCLIFLSPFILPLMLSRTKYQQFLRVLSIYYKWRCNIHFIFSCCFEMINVCFIWSQCYFVPSFVIMPW